jgi:hypothetical protein
MNVIASPIAGPVESRHRPNFPRPRDSGRSHVGLCVWPLAIRVGDYAVQKPRLAWNEPIMMPPVNGWLFRSR